MYQKIDYGPCSNYYECFEALADNNLILTENLPIYKKMINLLNKILYDYENVSKDLLYSVITENLEDFNVAINDFKRNLK